MLKRQAKVKVKISPTSKEVTGRDTSLRTRTCCSALLVSQCLNALPNACFKTNILINTTHSIIRYTQRLARVRCIRNVLGSVLDPEAGFSDFGFWRPRNEKLKEKPIEDIREDI